MLFDTLENGPFRCGTDRFVHKTQNQRMTHWATRTTAMRATG